MYSMFSLLSKKKSGMSPGWAWVSSCGADIKDSEAYTHLLHQIADPDSGVTKEALLEVRRRRSDHTVELISGSNLSLWIWNSVRDSVQDDISEYLLPNVGAAGLLCDERERVHLFQPSSRLTFGALFRTCAQTQPVSCLERNLYMIFYVKLLRFLSIVLRNYVPQRHVSKYDEKHNKNPGY
jgi:hypothetical protein